MSFSDEIPVVLTEAELVALRVLLAIPDPPKRIREVNLKDLSKKLLAAHLNAYNDGEVA